MIRLPDDSYREGYVFDSWYWDKDAWKKPFSVNALLDAPIKQNLSVHARFKPIEYKINYVTEGGAHTNPESYTVGDDINGVTNAIKYL